MYHAKPDTFAVSSHDSVYKGVAPFVGAKPDGCANDDAGLNAAAPLVTAGNPGSVSCMFSRRSRDRRPASKGTAEGGDDARVAIPTPGIGRPWNSGGGPGIIDPSDPSVLPVPVVFSDCCVASVGPMRETEDCSLGYGVWSEEEWVPVASSSSAVSNNFDVDSVLSVSRRAEDAEESDDDA